jgi:hypothetical protein
MLKLLIAGNLVYISEGGTMEWDTTALENIRWLRGVYMILYRHKTGGN